MAEERSLRGWFHGQRLPNPAAWGFKWKALEKLLRDQQRIAAERRQINLKSIELDGRIRQLERGAEDALARAIRAGTEDPTGAELAEARAEFEGVNKRLRALDKALDKVNNEVLDAVRGNADEWAREVRGRAAEKAADVVEAVRALRVAQEELAALDALAGWLERPHKGFAPATGPTRLSTYSSGEVSVEEVFDALLRDAADKTLSSEERTRRAWGAMGAVNTPAWTG